MSSGAIEALLSIRQHQRDGQRSPHKPLLVLLALGQLAQTGDSHLAWASNREKLADLIIEFGPPSRTSPNQAAAYPFTRLRSDGFWVLDRDVPMDRVGPLDAEPTNGRFEEALETKLGDRDALFASARAIVEAEFPPTLIPDVLTAVGLDPDAVYAHPALVRHLELRRRSRSWPTLVIQAWDRCCAFCGFDGQLGNSAVGLEAAHIRWFNFGGPDELDNGFALCSLHHKLFDRGALGLTDDYHVRVSPAFTARTEEGRRIYELEGKRLIPRPGTPLPGREHVRWHSDQVFKRSPQAA